MDLPIRVLLAIFYLISIVVISNSQQALGQETASKLVNNFLTYINPTYGIKINYPSDWQKQTMPLNNSGLGPVSVVIFLSPLRDAFWL